MPPRGTGERSNQNHLYMEEKRPPGVPAEAIRINPEDGFGPHVSDEFLNHYGEDSIFVTAAVDLLTWQFVGVLIKAQRLPQTFQPVEYGTPEMRTTLGVLLKTLGARGLEKPSSALMRAALGREPADAFEVAAGAVLGPDLVGSWLKRLEQRDYAGATALLAEQ